MKLFLAAEKAAGSSAGAAPSPAPAGLDVNCLLGAGERIHVALYLLRFLLQFAFQSISCLSYLCRACPRQTGHRAAAGAPVPAAARGRGTSHPSQALFPAGDSAGSPSPRAEPGTAVAPAGSELQPPPSPAARGRNWMQRQQFPRMDVHFHYTYTLSNWW